MKLRNVKKLIPLDSLDVHVLHGDKEYTVMELKSKPSLVEKEIQQIEISRHWNLKYAARVKIYI